MHVTIDNTNVYNRPLNHHYHQYNQHNNIELTSFKNTLASIVRIQVLNNEHPIYFFYHADWISIIQTAAIPEHAPCISAHKHTSNKHAASSCDTGLDDEE